MDGRGPPTKKANFVQNLTLRSEGTPVDRNYSENNTDIVFRDKETGQEKTAHKAALSQISPVFSTWFKKSEKSKWFSWLYLVFGNTSNQQERNKTEYPVPGDIEWEIFSNVISFLYGHQVEFEEDTLPDLFKAANYLQLDSLKVAIIESMTDQWELKDPSIVGAMCTAVASQTDPRVISGLPYTVSVRYFIRNIQMIVNNGHTDLSPIPYDVMMKIAQSEEIRAPEVQLYHFLKKWAKSTQQKLTHEEVQKLFGHVRYGTIPYTELQHIWPDSLHNCKNFWAAFNSDPDHLQPQPAIQQFTNRRCQEAVCLLNTNEQKKWTKEIKHACNRIYAIPSSNQECVINMTWSTDNEVKIDCYLKFTVKSLPTTKTYQHRVKVNENKAGVRKLSVAGLNVRPTSMGIKVELRNGSTQNIEFKEPYPWLITIDTVGMKLKEIISK